MANENVKNDVVEISPNLHNTEKLSLNTFGVKMVKQEYFNHDVFKEILRHNGIDNETKNRLKAYYKRRFNGNCVEVKYDFKRDCKANGLARMYAEKGLSLQMFPKDIRNALANGLYFDIDMKNAHPTILLEICQDMNWTCDHLEHYVQNRDTVLEEVGLHYKCSYENAKVMMNSMMYLCSVPFLPNDSQYDFVVKYRIQMGKIAENIKNTYPKA
jgi:hypothetical protein